MTAAPQQMLTQAFARALVRSLPRAQCERLLKIVRDDLPVSEKDLQFLPALTELMHEGGAGQSLAEPVRLVLGEALKETARLDNLTVQTRPRHPFVAITQGVKAASELVAQMPESLAEPDLQDGLFRVVQALKSGDLVNADAQMTVLSEQFDIPTLENCGPDYEPELSCVLFMKAIYADEEISPRATERLFEVLSALPKDASLLRGILYNVALDVFLRQQNMSEAEEAAHRALFHYKAAQENGVAFYVHLYLAVIGLWHGDLNVAEDRLAEARIALAQFEGAVANDDLLLRSFEMILSYEHGDDALVQHLMAEDDTIPFGELWPSVADPIISFGRRALVNKVTPAAALSWVRRWRVRQRRSLRFDRLISAQEALALQDLGRWQEADEVLGGIEHAEGADVQLARFASGLDRNPKSAELGRQLATFLERPNLSVRQRLMARLLAAHSALIRGVEREAARHLSTAIKEADPASLPSVWAENRGRVSELLSKRELRSELRRFPKLQRQIQKLVEVETQQKPDALTRQEFRILQLLAEAQSNKAIGLRLGIALPTVKFHVANLCRKTEVRNRQGVVLAAVRLGWLVKS